MADGNVDMAASHVVRALAAITAELQQIKQALQAIAKNTTAKQ
jgi:hypothetical protein